MSVGANGVGAGGDKVSSLAGFCKAFERMRGRTLTADERREAQALVDILVAEDMDPYMLHALVFRTELADTRAVMKQAAKQLTAATERLSGGDQKAAAEAEEGRLGAAVEAAVEAVQLLRSEAASRLESVEKVGPPAAVPSAPAKAEPATLSAEAMAQIEAAVVRALTAAPAAAEEAPRPRWLVAIRERWPTMAETLARYGKKAAWLWSAKWPISLMWAALALILMFAISVRTGVATRNDDLFLARVMSTPAGTAALHLAYANPNLAEILRSCDRAVQPPGHTVLTCKLMAPWTRQPQVRPTWISTAVAVVLDWLSSWPIEWVAVALVLPWVIVAALGFAKRGPATRLLWHPRKH